MTWKLAHNLQVRVAEVEAVYPGMTIGEIGNTAHLNEAGGSDHNPDARGIVHAIDIMTETDAANSGAAAKILAWLLSWTDDLQYVIHDRIIYGRDQHRGWTGAAYTGSDPHTNHIHVSGRHGSVGANSHTGNGYDTAAEAMTPPPLEDEMAISKDDLAAIAAAVWGTPDPVLKQTPHNALNVIFFRTGLLNSLTPDALGAAILKVFPNASGGMTQEQVGAAVHDELVAAAQTEAAALAATPTP